MSRPRAQIDDIPPLDREQIAALEQARQRLATLTNSLSNLSAALAVSDPLPPWDSFMTQTKIISGNFDGLLEVVNSHKALFDHLAVFPLPEFPGRTQEGLLGQLLRKKLEPGVEDWVAKSLEEGKAKKPLAVAADQEVLCDFAYSFCGQQIRSRAWGANFTLEESAQGIENVNTGLKRKLYDNSAPPAEGDEEGSEKESDEEAAEDDGGEMELVDIHRKPSGVGVEIEVRKDTEGKMANLRERPPMPLAEQLKYLTTGMLPRS